jgi:hypothetical protein
MTAHSRCIGSIIAIAFAGAGFSACASTEEDFLQVAPRGFEAAGGSNDDQGGATPGGQPSTEVPPPAESAAPLPCLTLPCDILGLPACCIDVLTCGIDFLGTCTDIFSLLDLFSGEDLLPPEGEDTGPDPPETASDAGGEPVVDAAAPPADADPAD